MTPLLEDAMWTPCPECDGLVDFQEMRECRECSKMVCPECWDADLDKCESCAMIDPDGDDE